MGNDKNILIIEPERIAGLELQQQLEKKGFSVRRPISLVDTEVSIAKHTPDLIIADTGIKQQNLFERIKKYLRKFKLPFIWIGTPSKPKANDGINVIGTFPKPFNSAKIVARIVKYFKRWSPVKQPNV